MAILINFVTKLYTIRKMNQVHSINVYTIQHLNHRELIQEEKFSLSLGSIFGKPFTLTFALLFSLANRTLRLTIFCPLQLTLLSVIIPWMFISRNKKMKRVFLNEYISPTNEKLEKLVSKLKQIFSNEIVPGDKFQA